MPYAKKKWIITREERQLEGKTAAGNHEKVIYTSFVRVCIICTHTVTHIHTYRVKVKHKSYYKDTYLHTNTNKKNNNIIIT